MSDAQKNLGIKIQMSSGGQSEMVNLSTTVKELTGNLNALNATLKSVTGEQDKVTGSGERLRGGHKRSADEAGGLSGVMSKLSKEMGNFSFQTWVAWMNTNLWTSVISGAVNKVDDLVMAGSKFAQMADGFVNVANSAGQSSESILNLTKNATDGLISQEKIMKSFNTMTSLGVKTTEEGFAKLSAAAVKMSKIMGTDVDYAMNSLATGMARQSIRVLDNLGVTFKASEAWEWYAKQQDITVKSMDEATKKIAWQEYAIEKLGEAAANGGTLVKTMGDAFQQGKVTMEDSWKTTLAWVVTQDDAMMSGIAFKDALVELGAMLEANKEKLLELLTTVVDFGTTMVNAGSDIIAIVLKYKDLLTVIVKIGIEYAVLSKAVAVGNVLMGSSMLPVSGGLKVLAMGIADTGVAMRAGLGVTTSFSVGMLGLRASLTSLSTAIPVLTALALAAMAVGQGINFLVNAGAASKEMNNSQIETWKTMGHETMTFREKLSAISAEEVNVGLTGMGVFNGLRTAWKAYSEDRYKDYSSKDRAYLDKIGDMYKVNFADLGAAQALHLQIRTIMYETYAQKHKTEVSKMTWGERQEAEQSTSDYIAELAKRNVGFAHFLAEQAKQARDPKYKIETSTVAAISKEMGTSIAPPQPEGAPSAPKKTALETVLGISVADFAKEAGDVRTLMKQFGADSPVVTASFEDMATKVYAAFKTLFPEDDEIRPAYEMLEILKMQGGELAKLGGLQEGFLGADYGKRLEKKAEELKNFNDSIANLGETSGMGVLAPDISDEDMAKYEKKINTLAESTMDIFDGVMQEKSPAQLFAQDFNDKITALGENLSVTLSTGLDEGWSADKMAEKVAEYDAMIAKMKASTDGWIAGLAKPGGGGLADVMLAVKEQIMTTGAMLKQFTDEIFNGMRSNLESFFKDFLSGNKSLKESFKDLAKNMKDTMISALAKILAQQVINHVTSMLLGKKEHMSQTLPLAKEAAVKAYLSMAKIPVVGPVLGAIAAAAAFSFVMMTMGGAYSAKQGAWKLPGGTNDPFPMLAHGEEMVIPARESEKIRSFVDNAVMTPEGNGGGVNVQVILGGAGDLLVLDNPQHATNLGAKLAALIAPQIQRSIDHGQSTADPYSMKDR